ncbi:hypothetical protein ACPDXS_000032 [Vibrio cholerae]|uniref:hypothetical protein n=1 Tax=Vibrio cholerae TaxID=666 RepID=UPI0028956ECE|nr:hypothetical protein [Vibrio cholerae]
MSDLSKAREELRIALNNYRKVILLGDKKAQCIIRKELERKFLKFENELEKRRCYHP